MNRRKTNSTPANKPLVLMIDDDADEQRMLIEAFKEVSPDYTVVCFDNGRTALAYLQQLRPHELPCLIVLDYEMPEWNGSEVLLRLRQLPPLTDVPVIFHSSSDRLRPGDTLGGNAVVPKAGTWKEMKENIHSFLFYSQRVAAW